MIIFFTSIAIFECTPSDRQMYPQGYMYPSLGTLAVYKLLGFKVTATCRVKVFIQNENFVSILLPNSFQNLFLDPTCFLERKSTSVFSLRIPSRCRRFHAAITIASGPPLVIYAAKGFQDSLVNGDFCEVRYELKPCCNSRLMINFLYI